MVKAVDGETHPVSTVGTVEELKWTMSEKLGFPASWLVLLAEGRVCGDRK